MERMIPGHGPKHIEAEHIERYTFAALMAPGKTVLDVGCGSGYGTEILGMNGAAYVTGIDKDLSERAVEPREKTVYIECDLEELARLGINELDMAVCFEVLEHVDYPVKLLEQIRETIRPGGTLLISTPNSEISSPDGKVKTPHHVIEYTQA